MMNTVNIPLDNITYLKVIILTFLTEKNAETMFKSHNRTTGLILLFCS